MIFEQELCRADPDPGNVIYYQGIYRYSVARANHTIPTAVLLYAVDVDVQVIRDGRQQLVSTVSLTD